MENIVFAKLMLKFNARENDIVLYLSILERQTKKICVDPNLCVSSLLALLPLDIIQVLARKVEEKFEDCEYSKNFY